MRPGNARPAQSAREFRSGGRPAMARRNKKAIDYSQFGDADDDDDEDFASIAAPSKKKSKRVHPKTKEKKEPQNQVPKGELQKRAPNKRIALDDKLLQRDLEVALALSVNEASLGICKVKDSQEQVLNESPKESDQPVRDFRQRTPSQQEVLTASQGSGRTAHSCETETVLTEELEADSSFNENSRDNFFAKKTAKENGKEGRKLNAKNEKAETTFSLKISSVVHKGSVKAGPTLKRAPTSPEPIGKPLKASSPAAPKGPSWTPPAASGSCNNPPGGVLRKSPTQSLRLGLSRLARVKPLHPSVASI